MGQGDGSLVPLIVRSSEHGDGSPVQDTKISGKPEIIMQCFYQAYFALCALTMGHYITVLFQIVLYQSQGILSGFFRIDLIDAKPADNGTGAG